MNAFRVIEAEKAHYDIAWMCALLLVARSSFYAWRAAQARTSPTPTQAARRARDAAVAKAFQAGRGAYGVRRVGAQLTRGGTPASPGSIGRSMRSQGLRACQPKHWTRTTRRGEDRFPVADLLGQDFTAELPGTRLVGDITYLRTGEGWLYLATVIDLATKMVVGWQLAPHMRTTLVTGALDMARAGGHITPGAIFHSDRGTQYTSKEMARYWLFDLEGEGLLFVT